MNQPVKLTEINENGYYEIRLESIGGLGANLCGKLLGELGALYLGLNSASFSSYGSEKRGSPVKAYIRWCDKEREVRVNSPVTNPHILGLFHEAMVGKLPVTAGVNEKSKVVINTESTPEDIRRRLELCGGGNSAVDPPETSVPRFFAGHISCGAGPDCHRSGCLLYTSRCV